MTTKAVMIARIGSELRRGTSIDTQIGAAIDTAITYYQAERLFTKDGSNTLTTVAGQSDYTLADQAWLGLVSRIDFVNLYIDNVARALARRNQEWMDIAITIANRADPRNWDFFAETMRFYPIPSAIWTVRVGGNFETAAPATTAETGNSWMLKGETLIRCHAKYELYTHVLANPQRAAELSPENEASATSIALRALRRRTTAKMASGIITPWSI